MGLDRSASVLWRRVIAMDEGEYDQPTQPSSPGHEGSPARGNDEEGVVKSVIMAPFRLSSAFISDMHKYALKPFIVAFSASFGIVAAIALMDSFVLPYFRR